MRILFRFRKDLRLDDDSGLAETERGVGGAVVLFCASEPEILSRPDMAAARALRARLARGPRRRR